MEYATTTKIAAGNMFKESKTGVVSNQPSGISIEY